MIAALEAEAFDIDSEEVVEVVLRVSVVMTKVAEVPSKLLLYEFVTRSQLIVCMIWDSLNAKYTRARLAIIHSSPQHCATVSRYSGWSYKC